MQHIAIIPDGNRRWAQAHKLKSIMGHKRGTEAIQAAVNVCIKYNIRYLSLYTFSLENFNRSESEKDYLFKLLADFAREKLPQLIKDGIRVRIIGDQSYFPESLKQTLADLEKKTAHLDTLQFNMLFCYGAKHEIVQAAKKLAQQVKDGVISVDDITQESFSNELWTAGIPDPDLIIRTGDVLRLSNFLLYQAAYTEFSFLPCYWPDVNEEVLEHCLEKFGTIKRNFGT
ncbi:MAG: di-trans,poly-cis-decaprenylcistransferase [Epsilonproteobacteria bacterium]|nr:di-trans,poly-cis-decaprenylcistransferase [Campylobacterota bacterium]